MRETETAAEAPKSPPAPREMTSKFHSVIPRAKPEESPQAGELETPRSARNDGLGRIDHHVRRRTVDKATAFKFAGLIAFLALMAIVVAAVWPFVADAFSEGGVERLVERVRDAGWVGVLMLLGMQFLQVVVAFIPGEVVQLAAGLMYGPGWGTVLILVGCVISSTVIYQLVHALGAPFVQGMASTEHLDRFRAFEESGKLDVVVFVLFLIPGLPKDVFTYLVPLTDMTYRKFIVLTTVGRIPGVAGSTYAAAGFADGQIIGPLVVLVILAAIAVLAVLNRERIMDVFDRKRG